MRKSEKILALLLAALCVAAVLVACNQPDPSNPTEQTTVAPESDPDQTTEPEDTTEPEQTPTVERVPDDRNLSAAEYSVLNIVGTDDFGRVILPVDGKINEDRYVGMFYFLTLGQHANHTGIYDINKITYEGTFNDAFTKYNTPVTPVGAAHFWGEPVWGYYHSNDPWVMRKQIEMLTMAGVDFLVLDTTNNVLYESVTATLFEILKEYQDAGWDVPRVVYYLGKHDNVSADASVFKRVYDIFYANDTYKSLWFTPNDPEKPMIIAPDNVVANFRASSDAKEKMIAEFFDFRYTQWPTAAPVKEPVYEYGAPWIEFELPQRVQEGWISLSIAQHVTVNMTDTKNSRGRGWHPTTLKKGKWKGENDHENWRQNLNFQAQWNTVLEMTHEQRATDARFVFLTGWNEWVAEKLRQGDGTYFTCDTFNAEYSRDIEPSRSSGMKDSAYLLTIINIHNDNFKPAVHYRYPATTPDITGDDAVWASAPTYRDFTGECADRNFKAMAGDTVYTDTTGRNDIDTVSILRDEQYLYFRVACVDNVTAYTKGDEGWMNIWLKTASAGENLFCGYEYVINRSVDGNKSTVLGADGKSVGEADVYVYGKVMIVRVPLAVVGLDQNNYQIEFKVTDNVQDMENDPLNLYSTGDAAPIGTLNFSFGY